MTTRADFERWLIAYGEAWMTRDADRAVAIFSDDARMKEGPFDEALRGSAQIRNDHLSLEGLQQDIQFSAEVVLFTDPVGVAEWACTLQRISDCARMRYSGVAIVKLDADGRCSDFRQWWHERIAVPGASDALVARADEAIERLREIVSMVESIKK